MNFFLKINKLRVEDICDSMKTGGQSNNFRFQHWEKPIINESKHGDIILWLGDIVLPKGYINKNEYIQKINNDFTYKKILETKGIFYAIRFRRDTKSIEIMSSFCGILPIYYIEKNDFLLISSNLKYLFENINNKLEISQRYLVEKLLFNYPLTHKTIFKNIKRLPANSSLLVNKTAHVNKYYNSSSLIGTEALKYKNVINKLTDCFIDHARQYYPSNELFYLSFTSGFDGRTLLAIAINEKFKPITFSFGTKNYNDLYLPMAQVQKLNITHKPFYLDSTNYLKSSLEFGKKLIEFSSGEANFARAHYCFAANELSKKSKYMITGNFGSELFRAFHNTGVVCSKWLYRLFLDGLSKKLFNELKTAPELKLIQDSIPNAIFEEIFDDLKEQEWMQKSKDLTLNQKFYIFVFDEMFRKYFGPEVTMQNNYLYNRTPFLDFSFIKELYKTDLGGAYNNFFENNLVKRFKGQVFYAYLIQKTSDLLYKMPTGKGYRPKDILTLSGKMNLLLGVIKKKMLKADQLLDPFAVNQAYLRNKHFYFNKKNIPNLFDFENTEKLSPNISTNTLYHALSLNYYINYLNDQEYEKI